MIVKDYVLAEDVEISVTYNRASDTFTPPYKSENKTHELRRDPTRSSSSNSSDTINQDDIVARTYIEQAAIAIVKKYSEYRWIDANIDNPNNPGFDLCELDENNNQCRWIEVKGLAGEHTGKPNMSETQRGFALGLKAAGKGDQYTHITVAHAHTKNPQIIRYDNPTAEYRHRVDDEDD